MAKLEESIYITLKPGMHRYTHTYIEALRGQIKELSACYIKVLAQVEEIGENHM